MTDRTRVFIPYGGKLREIDDYDFAVKLADAARKQRKPMPIAVRTVGLNSAVKVWAVMSFEGNEPAVYRPVIAMVTTQARRMAEAAIWIGAVHAFVALGVFAQYAGACVIERPMEPAAASTMRPSMLRPVMAPDNPLLGLAKPVDFDTFFASEPVNEDVTKEWPS